MKMWEYIKFESRRNEIVSINGQDPRKKESWEILGLSFTMVLGERINEYEFLQNLGKSGWEIIGICMTDVGSQVMIAKRMVSD